MWTAVAPCDVESPAPSARSKHSVTLVGDQVYLLGGRNGNLPMRDFWKYNLVNGKWLQLKPTGDKLPCLQEHTAVAYRDNIYVFGGEVGFSAGTETPLWMYDVRSNAWRKVRSKKGVSTPKGRRGHTALVHRGTMLIYGGYQDLRGSCCELWAYHFETESWHLLSTGSAKGQNGADNHPAPRHKHSAVLHDDAMWIYGGMTDLQERGDLWKWDIVSKTWFAIKTKQSPGPLHSHAACRLPSSMIVFGGERNGLPTNDLWKFSFTTEIWEKINSAGMKPQPRAESVAFAVSELLLKDTSAASLETKANRTRLRTCTSADRGSRHSSYFPNNKVSPYEQTYVFNASNANYVDGSDLAQQYSENGARSHHPPATKSGFLQEISKLSQINISRLNNKCSYTVLTGGQHTDSTESLLKQHASSPPPADVDDATETYTPTRGTMVKSRSAYIIKKKYQNDVSPTNATTTTPASTENGTRKKVEFNAATIKKIPREPISVPNFSLLTLPTPTLTPVEAARLVFLDSDDEREDDEEDAMKNDAHESRTNDTNGETDARHFGNAVKRGESYNSHLGYADNPLYQHLVNSSKYNNQSMEAYDENVSSTSDYASIETVNRLSSASNYSVKTGTPQEETVVKQRNANNNTSNSKNTKDGPFGFCNPNYMGPEIKSLILTSNGDGGIERRQFQKLINTSDSLLLIDDAGNNVVRSDDEELLELQNYSKVIYRNNARNAKPPRTLALTHVNVKQREVKNNRASSASRIERNRAKTIVADDMEERIVNGSAGGETVANPADGFVPLYVFIFGGKEHGQVTVFQRPISIWKLKLF